MTSDTELENLKRAQLRLLNARRARTKLEEQHAEAYKEWCEAMQDYESAVRGYMADIMSRQLIVFDAKNAPVFYDEKEKL